MVFTTSPIVFHAFLAFAVSISVLTAIKSLLLAGRRPKNIPPGPPTVPILGNEHQIPASDGHFLFTQWARKYGPIFSLKRFSNTTLVLTDRGLIKSLVDKKSNIYSHRPASLVAHLITNSDHLLVMQYGEMWRRIRKLVHQYFMESACEKDHWRVQEAEATQMLHDYLVSPENHMLHPKRYSNSITNSLVFGIRTKTVHDEYMDRLYDIMDKWSLVLEVGATPPVDSSAWLRWIPQFFLGNWKKKALEVNRLMTELYSDVLVEVRKRREEGVARGSFMDMVLDQNEKHQLSENQLRFLGGVLMEGGSDTSSSLILTMIVAMTKYPAVQARAHAEIDAAFDDERSPGWSDFSKLPFVNMIIKELHRWRPVSPLGVSHALAEDDQFNGMHLPKGSTVILNVWGMHQDPVNYSNPEHFDPARFEKFPALASKYAAGGASEVRDHLGYGAGRRICPGIHLAERNLFIGVAKLLWAFEFSEPDGVANDISAETGASQGFLHCPKEYRLRIRMRGARRKETILREMEGAKEIFKSYG